MVVNTDNISSDRVELFKSIVNGYIDEYYIDIQNLNEKGEGFVSDVIFVTLTNKKTKVKEDVIVKQQKTVNGEPFKYTINMFENEIYFYKTIWPTLTKYYQDATGKLLKFVPKFVGTSKSQLKKVALENLRSQGFVTHDKKKPFDDEHFSSVLNSYGVFHALSMALREQNVEVYNKIVDKILPIECLVFNDSNFCGKFLKLVSRQFQELIKPKDEILIEKLKLYEEIGTNIVESCVTEGKLNGVILHGDSWSNNFMFKYDDSGKLKDLRMLDFQLICRGSPVFDLSYLIYSGGSTEIFDKLDHYLRIYHSSLTQTLQEFGLDAEEMYSFGVLKDEWKKYCKYGYAMGIMLWNIKLADKDAIEFAEIEDLNPFKIADGMQEEYEQRIKELILHMHKNDFF